MATLYWRHKKKGKWTWTRVKPANNYTEAEIIRDLVFYRKLLPLEEEE